MKDEGARMKGTHNDSPAAAGRWLLAAAVALEAAWILFLAAMALA
ncbi:MAG: hypothetical protein ABSG86_18640 [Thermoguttaceae bacterium]|jgi:hypothetical protein